MRNVSPDVRSTNLAIPCPCIGPQRSVRRMIRSSVPCMISSRSVDFDLGLMGRQPTTLRVDALLNKMFQGLRGDLSDFLADRTSNYPCRALVSGLGPADVASR